jgi:sporulation protein YunB
LAKFRGRFPRRGPLPFRYVILLTFVFFTFSTATGLWVVNEGLKPTLMSYAESQTRSIATLVISNAINNKISDVLDLDEIIKESPVEGGNNPNVKFNAEIVNKVKAETTKLVQANIVEAEKGNLDELEKISGFDIETEKNDEEGIVYYVPLGQATNNVLLGNLGPKIPVRFTAIGDVSSDVKAKIEDFGINNAYIQVYIEITVKVQIIIPFATKIATIKEDIPVAMYLMKGDVPQYYNSGGAGASPSIDVPLD